MKIIKCHADVGSGMHILPLTTSVRQAEDSGEKPSKTNGKFKSIKVENDISWMLWEIVSKASG